jgi:hypothetical protein
MAVIADSNSLQRPDLDQLTVRLIIIGYLNDKQF